MQLNSLMALSPIDGRYADKFAQLRPIFSEFGLMYYRLLVEIRWLEFLAANENITEIPALSTEAQQTLSDLLVNFSLTDAKKIKEIEKTTNHDVKALEYFLKQKFAQHSELTKVLEFIHFACTSEDINNLAYALMVKQAREEVLLPLMQTIIEHISKLAHTYANQPLLARTHGQPASPTTVGKEFAVFKNRLLHQYQQIQQINIRGKFNGAVGNFNAHFAAYPNIDWPKLSHEFVNNLHLSYNPYTTQIEPHDYIAELLHAIHRFNSILIDLCRDVWGYIALEYFAQQNLAHEVGSSTMPHKINPIDFENAEGNLGLSNAISTFLASQLLTSRWQRDLVDSTLLRNLGISIAHACLAYQGINRGLNKLKINTHQIEATLNSHWEVLTEAVQTVMRRYGCEEPYEKLKTLSRGQKLEPQELHRFIDNLPIPIEAKEHLKGMTPLNYIGNANQQAEAV